MVAKKDYNIPYWLSQDRGDFLVQSRHSLSISHIDLAYLHNILIQHNLSPRPHPDNDMDSLDDVMAEDASDEEISFSTDVVEEDGDLLIIVREIKGNNDFKESRHAFLVDSRAVSESSAIWKALVPPKRGGSGHNVIEVTGSIYHHEILFLLMHEQFCRSFEHYDEYDFFNLLKFTDGWGVTDLILPWFVYWIDCNLLYLNPDYKWLRYMDLETLMIRLWTVWALGHREAFQSLIGFLVKNVNSDREAKLSFEDEYLSEAFDKFGVPEIPGLVGTFCLQILMSHSHHLYVVLV